MAMRFIDTPSNDCNNHFNPTGILILLLLMLIPTMLASDCPEVVGRWPYGPSMAVLTEGNYTFLGSGAVVTLQDISNPSDIQEMSEVFLSADAIILLAAEIVSGIVINEEVIEENLNKNAPFLLTEELLMRATMKDGDRQMLHEKIREHSREAMKNIKKKGVNDLVDRLVIDPAFAEFKDILKRKDIFTGRAQSQVEEFIRKEVKPYLDNFDLSGEIPGTSV